MSRNSFKAVRAALLFVVFAFALVPAYVRAQAIPDLTSRLEHLGNALTSHYSDLKGKSLAYDLQLFDNRIYIGHGSTSNSSNIKIIYFDLEKEQFLHEVDAAGNTVWMRSELSRGMRVQDGELLLEDYDPHGQLRFYRKRAGEGWTIRTIGPDAHARDLYKFGDEYFVNFGVSTATYPRIYHSANDGEKWNLIKQSSLYSGYSLVHNEFFEFDGKLYVTGGGQGYNPDSKLIETSRQPFMLRYSGEGAFEVAYRSRQDFLKGFPNDYDYITQVNKVGENILFRWGANDVYLATSIEPARVSKVTALPSLSVADMISDGTHVYVLMHERLSSTRWMNHVYQVNSRGQVKGIFKVSHSQPIGAIERVGNTFFLSASGVNFFRLRVELPDTAPDPVPAPSPAPTNLALDLKVFLQGPLDAERNKMRASIKSYLDVESAFKELPSAQYGQADYWDVAASTLDRDVVDFVVLELRTGTAASSRVARRVALLMADGSVRGFDGQALPRFNDLPAGKYYVVVRHRNHLDVMSAAPVDFSSGTAAYDFTTATNKAYGSSALTRIKSGVYALYSGDMDASNIVDARDVVSAWSPQNGYAGYRNADLDLSGFVNAFDLLKMWMPNSGRRSQVPD